MNGLFFLLSVIFGLIKRKELILDCDAAALCIIDVTQPTDATGHANILTYIINSAIFPVVIFPLKLSRPPIYIVNIVLVPINVTINGRKNASILIRDNCFFV